MKTIMLMAVVLLAGCSFPGIDNQNGQHNADNPVRHDTVHPISRTNTLDDPHNGANYLAGIHPPLTLASLPGYHTNDSYIDSALVDKVLNREGTNLIGIYLGMLALRDGDTNHPGVMMFSASSGGLLRWISYDEFKAVYVDKTKPEYPAGQ